MYAQPSFEENRPDVLHELMHSHPFGLLVTSGPDGMEANGLPFLLDARRGPHGTLRGHVARGNPLWRDAAGTEAMIVFQGPQTYVTPSWYATKAQTGKVVPTWNYVLVQVRGTLRAIDDAAWLRQFLGELTDRHEAPRALPWKVDDAPADFTARLIGAIVGIEMEIRSIGGKWKLNQNRPEADRAGVVKGLREEGGSAAMADAVEQAMTPRP
jgi:transcriptional regulator